MTHRLLAGLRWGRAAVTAVVTGVLVLGAGLLVGLVAESLQGTVDEPYYDAVAAGGTDAWTDVVATLTTFGNVPQTRWWTAIIAVALAVWFASRGWRWWVPLVVGPAAWLVEKAFQSVWAKVIDRDRELLALIGTPIGNFPSGGVARTLVVFGTAAVLVVHYARTSRRTTTWLLVVAGLCGLAEAYFRARLNQHWLTDVVGGYLCGVMLVAAVWVTLRAWDPDPPRGPRAADATGGRIGA
ncbi:MAG: hypothetical protein CMH83_15230 [Nocardioides sp.]|nr:hypothetical protein [Nocardioides sp.]